MENKMNKKCYRNMNPRTRRMLIMSFEPKDNENNESNSSKSETIDVLQPLKPTNYNGNSHKMMPHDNQQNNDYETLNTCKISTPGAELVQVEQQKLISVVKSNPCGLLTDDSINFRNCGTDDNFNLLQNIVFAGDSEHEEHNSYTSLESTKQNSHHNLRPVKDKVFIADSDSDKNDFSPDVSEYLPSPERSRTLFGDFMNESSRTPSAGSNISDLFANDDLVASPTSLNKVNSTHCTPRQNKTIDLGNPETPKTYLDLDKPEATEKDSIDPFDIPSTSNAQTVGTPHHNDNQASINIATENIHGNTLSSIENLQSTEQSHSEDQTKTLTRKRKRLFDDWQDLKNKKLKDSGKAYTSVRSKKKQAPKYIGSPCSCKKKCFEKFTQEQRKHIFNQFWNIADHESQWHYVLRFVKSSTIKKMALSRINNRTQTLSYSLPLNGEIVPVCKVFFLKTLSIGDSLVYTAIEKSKSGENISDSRGCHNNRPRKMKEDTEKSIIEHINLFPVKESHYVRENTKRLYLHEDVRSIRKMYRLYREWFEEYCKENPEVKEATRRQYETIFNTRFNYSFFKPKKDMCSTCALYEEADPERKVTLEDEYKAHILRKERIRELKRKEKEETDAKTTTVATFDLEKVLNIPQSNVGVFHYKRKYPIYNFTVHNSKTKTGHCYVWHYQIAKRGAIEIGSCLLCFIQEELAKGIHNFSFYSDSCPGQNKNRFIFALYLYAAKKYNVNITHRFFEVGHSQSEVDSIHSCIERAKQNKIIYTPDQMYGIIMNAKTEGEKYVVKEMQQSDFFDIKQLVHGKNWDRDLNNIKIKWLQIKEVHVSSTEPSQLMFRYDFDEDYHKMNTQTITRSSRGTSARLTRGKRQTNQENHSEDLGTTTTEEVDLKQAYSQLIPISKALYNDLMSLCASEAIPRHYQNFYKSLRCDNNTHETDSEDNEDI